MRIYSLSLTVAATEAYAPDEVLNRLRAALAAFEAGRSDDNAHQMISVKATVVSVADAPAGLSDARAWRSAAMQRIGKSEADDVLDTRKANVSDDRHPG